jgi:ATP-dependent DNA helicase RecQ
MRRTVARPRAAPRARALPNGELSADDVALLDRLKAWRLVQARAQAVPAYVILHDRTLAEIARQRPRDLGALSGISGIGARKLERYGPAIVDVVSGRQTDDRPGASPSG